MNLPFHTADHRKRLAKVSLRVTRIMPERHEHLTLTLPPRQNVVLHNRQAAAIAVLVTQAL